MENLKVTHYRNGDAIPNVTDGAIWGGLTTGAYCEYDNNIASVATYGRLYNWYAAVDGRDIAPVGWHVPSDAEWKQLEMYLGMSQPSSTEVAEVDEEEVEGSRHNSLGQSKYRRHKRERLHCAAGWLSQRYWGVRQQGLLRRLLDLHC
jgi:uncharacterized protein (TIGR02145 family)